MRPEEIITVSSSTDKPRQRRKISGSVYNLCEAVREGLLHGINETGNTIAEHKSAKRVDVKYMERKLEASKRLYVSWYDLAFLKQTDEADLRLQQVVRASMNRVLAHANMEPLRPL